MAASTERQEGTAGRPRIFTIGHSNMPTETFIEMLRANGVSMVVDVRSVPRSRHNPLFNKETLPGTLEEAGIGYRHCPGLGGFRKVAPGLVNAGWKQSAFRGYADYMQTEGFAENLQALMSLAERETVAVMCAEAVPWRCHRSLIADALTVRGWQVLHIMGGGKRHEHELTDFAVVEDRKLTYPGDPTLPVQPA